MIVFVLFSRLAFADADLGIVYNPKPTITLDFTNETDTVIINSGDFNLTNSSGNLINYFNNPVEISAKIFRFSPKSPALTLKDGEQYTFTVRYHDLAPNYKTSVYTFTVVYPLLNITLVAPRFGFTAFRPFNFSIKVDRPAVGCRYSKTQDKPYDEMTLFFDQTIGSKYIKKNFEDTGFVYVRCIDSYNKESPETFELILDDINPILSLSADDITEVSSIVNGIEKYSTILKAATDKDGVCRYTDDPDLDYEEMELFPDYDEANEGAYKTTHEKELTEADLADGQVNTYYAVCKAKNGLLSSMGSVDINVNTNTTPSVSVHDPKRYISDTTPLFNVTTNRNGVCDLYKNSVNLSNKIGPLSGTPRIHQRTITPPLALGAYT